jgi:YbgC/YbaW family acyl-CoA thioester hydrolase
MNEPRARRFQLSREVEWGDCDGAGIIYYPTYFRWMDAATWALVRAVGFDANRMRTENRAMSLVTAECQFLIAAWHGDRCEVVSCIDQFGRTSFVVAHEIVRADGTLLAKGTEERVWARYENGPGTPLKGEPISGALISLLR